MPKYETRDIRVSRKTLLPGIEYLYTHPVYKTRRKCHAKIIVIDWEKSQWSGKWNAHCQVLVDGKYRISDGWTEGQMLTIYLGPVEEYDPFDFLERKKTEKTEEEEDEGDKDLGVWAFLDKPRYKNGKTNPKVNKKKLRGVSKHVKPFAHLKEKK